MQAAVAAGVMSGAPSTAEALIRTRSVRAASDYVIDATARIGVLVPPYRPGLVRGVIAHGAISLMAAELIGAALPKRGAVAWGAVAGLAIGIVTVGLLGRRIPAIAELPLAPQLADNIAFGLVFAAVVDRST